MWIVFLTQIVLNKAEGVGNFSAVYGFPNFDIPLQIPLSALLTRGSDTTRGGERAFWERDSSHLEAQAWISS